eukprot:CAMPEP_0172309358 /NCGR_PEP_ID=MMETSP1058-20130122/9674_1 /TAXON_ID=83371 /ORGANISM="Detonula confervacea, Strain CCMP 353" /LENGTH=500 /DNA_ID=CAMNT_0013021971 /DNA_START=99 /DNA_END=1601 /DNA_ORIENTATION=-
MAAKLRNKRNKKASVEAVVDDAPPAAAAASPKKKKGGAATPKSKSKGKGKKSKKADPPPSPPKESSEEEEESDDEDDMKLTLEALDAMSDDDSDGGNDGQEEEDGEDDVGGNDNDAEALALRKMISDGKFDDLLKKKPKKKEDKKQPKETKKNAKKAVAAKEEESEEEVEEAVLETSMEIVKENEDKDDESSDSDDDKESEANMLAIEQQKKITQALALSTALQAADRHLPWAETFAMVAPTPLPFGPLPSDADVTTVAAAGKKRQRTEEGEDDGEEEEDEYTDIHDDLKREVAFYENALESVVLAREQCEQVGIPFTRPEDFFAEMVKSDDHMAKIKDRLIFETKKMEAVERRKSNKEQTVMAKERHAHRLSEKAKLKKAHMSEVDDWKKSAERGRPGLGGKVKDWQDDEAQLRGMGGGDKNGKRMNANKKFGFGGKSGRFKQNDKRDLNDMSGYNPRGGFGGVGKKTEGSYGGKGKGGGGGGGGNKRPGKRARDSARK